MTIRIYRGALLIGVLVEPDRVRARDLVATLSHGYTVYGEAHEEVSRG